ncbi:hypothetical protein HOF92_07990 [bacterium]|jgi:hypothetical protein|nr:hypothetical protein [bacterium]
MNFFILDSRNTFIVWIYRILGLLCVVTLVMVTFYPAEPSGTALNALPHGDLYEFSRVRHFSQKLPAQLEREDILPTKQRIYLVGDSFTWIARGHRPFPDSLQRETSLGVHASLRLQRYNFHDIPQEAKKGDILILQSVERSIPYRFLKSRKVLAPPALQRVRDWFQRTEPRLRSLLCKFPLVSELENLRLTFLFDFMGEISPFTPVFQLNPPFLFGQFEVQSQRTGASNWIPSESQLDAIVWNLKTWQQQAKKRGMRFLFLAVPNKASVYTDLASIQYSEFLPLLYKSLQKEGIKVVQLLAPFRESSRILYHGTDTHWNQQGVSLAAKLTASAIFEGNQEPVTNRP